MLIRVALTAVTKRLNLLYVYLLHIVYHIHIKLKMQKYIFCSCNGLRWMFLVSEKLFSMWPLRDQVSFTLVLCRLPWPRLQGPSVGRKEEWALPCPKMWLASPHLCLHPIVRTSYTATANCKCGWEMYPTCLTTRKRETCWWTARNPCYTNLGPISWQVTSAHIVSLFSMPVLHT